MDDERLAIFRNAETEEGGKIADMKTCTGNEAELDGKN